MRTHVDLMVVAAAAVACAGGALAGAAPTPLSVAFAVPLVLVLPGYAIVEALWDREHDRPGVVDLPSPTPGLDGPGRLVLVLSLSLGADVVLAIFLNLAFGLTARSWAAALTATTCGACAIALWRRGPGDNRKFPLRRFHFRPADIVTLAIAAVIASVAIGLARTPLSAKQAQGYTMLWLTRSTDATVAVGAQSGELRATRYRLVVRAGSRIVYSQSGLQLAPGERVQRVLRMQSAGVGSKVPVEAVLYRVGDPAVYRRARLSPRGAALR